ncbi:DUF3107 domain-containing protein [Tessaracoccus rhinocerotis]|uniref:DUF3107 domain-containing protein n=1 Tax=Tessaracoccus rhinocerotis TaxID=1689449 RepID=A0A553K3V4_9ACTN|nr:DUF3107 domain-containing protein [Tessaracoccus rhinocerotis]TRY19382.1 DUF3107 domain-containing protein [Tessaracoccus rhinocerotis]
MDVKIGIADVARELTVKTELAADEVVTTLASALDKGGLFELTDDKGRRVVVPAAKVAYVDLGAADERPVGFGAV